MITCPNKSSHEYKALEKAVGSAKAHYLWNYYDGSVPVGLYKDYVDADYQIFYQLDVDPQKDTLDNILKMTANVKQVLVGDEVQYQVNGELGYERVTSEAKKAQEKKFGVREATKAQEAQWAIDRTIGTLAHKIASIRIQESFPEYNQHVEGLNNTELAIENLDSITKSINRAVDKLILAAKKEGAVLVSEARIADTNTKKAGTADILKVRKDGSVDIYDFKSLSNLAAAPSKSEEWDIQLSGYKNILEATTNAVGKKMTVHKQRILPVSRINNESYKELIGTITTMLEKANKKKPTDQDIEKLLPEIYGTIKAINMPLDPSTKNLTEIPITSELTDNNDINKQIAVLVNQIKYSEANLQTVGSKEAREALKISINSKKKFIEKLQTKASVIELLTAARIDLASMDRMIRSDKYDPGVMEQDYLDTATFYSNIVELFTPSELDEMGSQERLQVEAIAGYASIQLRAIKNSGRERIIKAAKEHTNIVGLGTIQSEEDLFNPVKQGSWWATMTHGLSATTHPLLATLKKLVDRAFTLYRDKSLALKDKLVLAIKDLKAETSGDIWEPFLQKNEKGELTGNLIEEVTYEYWIDRSKAKQVGDKKWFDSYTELDRDYYNKQRENYVKWLEGIYTTTTISEFIESNTTKISDKNKLKELAETYAKARVASLLKSWEAEHGTVENPNIMLCNKPKLNNKYQDSRFETIKNSPAKLKFFNLYTDTMKELNTIIPYNDKTRKNFIPNFQATFIDMAMRSGVGTAIQNDWFQWDGISIDFDNTSKELTSISGEPLRHIPISGISSLRDAQGRIINAENKSYDLGLVLQRFADSVYKYQELSEIRSVAQSINSIIKNQDVVVTDKFGVVKTRKIAGGSRFATQSNNFINKVFFGKTEEKDITVTVEPNAISKAFGLVKKDKDGVYQSRVISITKMGDFMLKYVAMKNLGFNLFSSSVNLGQGVNAGFIESFAKRYYAPKDYVKALKMVSSFDNKAKLLADYFDIVQHEFTEKGYKELTTNKTNNILSEDKAFVLQEFGESAAQNTVLIATLSSGKFGITLEDFDVVDDKLVLKREISSDEISAFRAKVKSVNANLIGNYDPLDFMQAKNNLIGRALLQHRTWLPAMLNERWGSERYDYILEKKMIGRYRLLGKKIGRQILLDFAKGGLLNSNKEAMEKKYDPEAIAAMKANLAELAIILVILALGWGLLDDDEPEDDTGAQKYARRTFKRIFAETTFFWNPVVTYDILMSPVAAVGIFQDAGRLIDHTSKAMWGDNPEEATPGKYVRRLVPYMGQLERFYRQIITGEEDGWYK